MNKPSFKIKDKVYTFEDITLRNYYKLMDILAEQKENSEFEVVECLTGCPKEDLTKLKYQDWLVLWEETVVLINELSGKTDSIKPTMFFQDVKYGLPSVEDLTVGEFADLEVILSSPGAKNKLNEVAAVLYRPVLEEVGGILTLEDYDSKGFRQRAELFMDLPISAVRSANAFFLLSANSLLRNTAESLLTSPLMKTVETSLKDQIREALTLQQENGGTPSISFLEETLLDLVNQQSSLLEKRSTGLVGRRMKLGSRIWNFKNKLNTLQDNGNL
jgi:hypothetical protein